MADEAFPSDFDVVVSEEGDGWTMRVSGEIDLLTAPQLSEHLGRLNGRVTVDFADVTFIDSSGLSVLVREHQRLDGSDGRLTLRGLNPTTLGPFEITGLDSALHIEDSGRCP